MLEEIKHQKECIQQDLMEKYKVQSYQLYHPIIQNLSNYLIADIVKICCAYSSMELCKDCIETKHLQECWYPKLLKKHPCNTDLEY